MIKKDYGHGGRGDSTLKKARALWARFWHFFWEEDSLLSWIINILVAFLLIKGVIYPGLGLVLHTTHPVVAVISTSMEHEGNFDKWWFDHKGWYDEQGITQENFKGYDFRNGFNRGDIMILNGLNGEMAQIGEVIVYNSYIRKEPIIHRVIDVKTDGENIYYTTKGDKNLGSYPFEQDISSNDVVGKAIFRIPCLGWVKIGFVCTVNGISGKDSFINCMRGE